MLKGLVIIIIVLSGFFIEAQNLESGFRTVKGTIFDHKGKPMPGQSVLIKHTELGTTTDWDGNFCLLVPKNQIIFIEISCCFTPIFRVIEPNEKELTIRIGRKSQERKTRKAHKKWEPIKTSLSELLEKSYSGIDYRKMEKNICR